MGETLAIVDEGVSFLSVKVMWASTRSAQGNGHSVVRERPYQLGWRPAACEGRSARAPQHRAATISSACIGSAIIPSAVTAATTCSAGEGAQQCKLHCEQDEYMDLRTRTCMAQPACAYNQWGKGLPLSTRRASAKTSATVLAHTTKRRRPQQLLTVNGEIANCCDSNPAEACGAATIRRRTHRGRFQSGHHTIAPFQGTHCETSPAALQALPH